MTNTHTHKTPAMGRPVIVAANRDELNPIDNMLPSTPAEARAIGSPKYFTGTPCKKGHISPRLTVGNKCIKCRSEINKAYRETDAGAARTKASTDRWVELNSEYLRIKYIADNLWLRSTANPCYAWREINPHVGYSPMELNKAMKPLKQAIELTLKPNTIVRQWGYQLATPIKDYLAKGITDTNIILAKENFVPVYKY